MNAILNRSDIDNLKLVIDKMKGIDFDAAQKMELLVEVYERQLAGGPELDELHEAVEDLPGYEGSASYVDHVKDTADMLERALENVQEWLDSKDDEPLDEAVKRLVKAVVDGPNTKAEKLEKVLGRIIAVVDRGESDALIEVRNLAVDALS